MNDECKNPGEPVAALRDLDVIGPVLDTAYGIRTGITFDDGTLDDRLVDARGRVCRLREAMALLIDRAERVASRELAPLTDANADEQYDRLGLRAAIARCKGE